MSWIKESQRHTCNKDIRVAIDGSSVWRHPRVPKIRWQEGNLEARAGVIEMSTSRSWPASTTKKVVDQGILRPSMRRGSCVRGRGSRPGLRPSAPTLSRWGVPCVTRWSPPGLPRTKASCSGSLEPCVSPSIIWTAANPWRSSTAARIARSTWVFTTEAEMDANQGVREVLDVEQKYSIL